MKNYFTGAFQVFYTRSRSIHSNAFIYLKSQKTVCEGVNLLWSCEMPRGWCQLQLNEKKLFHTSFFKHFDFISSEYIRITSSEEALKVWEHNFWKCKWKVVLLVIYMLNYDSFKSIFFMLNYGITFSWGFSWVQFLSNKLEFFVSCNNIKGYKAMI